MARRGARFRMTGDGAFIARASAFETNLRTTGAQAAVDAAKHGAEVMERVIETSGTGWEDRAGRVASGDMLKDVGFDSSAEGTGKTRSAGFGWINGFVEYYRHQEEGFSNLRKDRENEGKTWGGTAYSGSGGPPGWTEGMGAYATAFIEARERFRDNIDGITKRAWYKK